METPEINWSEFIIETPIKAGKEDITNAWTTQEGLEKWFLRLAEFSKPDGTPRNKNEKIETGDTYRWLWHGWPDSVEEHGEVLEPKDNEFLRFTFGEAGIVSLLFTQRDGVLILVLRQEDIPEDEASRMNFHTGCKTGWTYYLANLNSVLQGGIDLRNKNQKLRMD